jgi:hypothetical protein
MVNRVQRTPPHPGSAAAPLAVGSCSSASAATPATSPARCSHATAPCWSPLLRGLALPGVRLVTWTIHIDYMAILAVIGTVIN